MNKRYWVRWAEKYGGKTIKERCEEVKKERIKMDSNGENKKKKGRRT